MSGTMHDSPENYLAALSAATSRIDAGAVQRYVDLLFESWRDGRQVLVFGNGGSLATASHCVADLVKTASVAGLPRLRALCLSDNGALFSAISNDISYDDVFAHSLQSYCNPGDVAVAISVSGNSRNVLRACEWAREKGVKIVAMTGFDGGRLAKLCDVHIHVPCDNFGIVEDLHLAISHMAAQAFHGRLVAESEKA